MVEQRKARIFERRATLIFADSLRKQNEGVTKTFFRRETLTVVACQNGVERSEQI
jgi:hypothetical protein